MSKELIILAADKSIHLAVQAILTRHQALGIRPIPESQFDIVVQPQHDASVYLTAHEFLRPQSARYEHALVMCDLHGSGSRENRMETETSIEARLRQAGWGDRAAAVVIDPELEIWVWSDSPHVDELVGWHGREPTLREWLRAEGYLTECAIKPSEPQECLDKALRLARRPRSSALFRSLAEQVSLNRCIDPAFEKLRTTLRRWFPLEPQA